MPGSPTAGDLLQDPDPVLHEPEEPGVPGEPVPVRHATAPDDRAQRQHGQTHVVAATDAQSHTQGGRRAVHVPRSARGHGRAHRDAHPTRGGPGQRAGEAAAQPSGVLAMTVKLAVGPGRRPRHRRRVPLNERNLLLLLPLRLLLLFVVSEKIEPKGRPPVTFIITTTIVGFFWGGRGLGRSVFENCKIPNT